MRDLIHFAVVLKNTENNCGHNHDQFSLEMDKETNKTILVRQNGVCIGEVSHLYNQNVMMWDVLDHLDKHGETHHCVKWLGMFSNRIGSFALVGPDPICT
jgi:hypothetical protein